MQLGQFIASRGGLRAGAVLFEEARQFGGDSAVVARALAPLYARLFDWPALASLEPSPLLPAERERAVWLSSHPTRLAFGDTVIRIQYRPGRGGTLGTVLLRIGRAELAAAIDPATFGFVIPANLRAEVKMFGDSSGRTAAVSARIGLLSLQNIPTTLANDGEAVRIGFDVLHPYSPTFNPGAGTITLHRPARRWRPGAGTRVPALYDSDGLRVLFNGAWTPSSASNAARLLTSRAWTWDARRGDVVLLTP